MQVFFSLKNETFLPLLFVTSSLNFLILIGIYTATVKCKLRQVERRVVSRAPWPLASRPTEDAG